MENEETYHYDFTTASELEIFIASLEEILQEWKLTQKSLKKKLEKNDFKTKEWCSSSEKITFAEVEFQLIRIYLKCDDEKDSSQEHKSTDSDDCGLSQALDDLLSLENDFFLYTVPPTKEAHPIARWYGLRDFLILTPKLSSSVASESQIKLWLSSLCIACSNTGCQVPFFIQAKEPWQYYFLGVCQSRGYHTDFEMVHLKRIPLHCKYVTGLLTLFKSKIDSGLLHSPITISVQFMYTLKNWTIGGWKQKSYDLDFLNEDRGISDLSKLPFGTRYDPIQEFFLNAIWPYLRENTVIDNESYSDLEPTKAPLWTASIRTLDKVSCFLTDCFTEFMSLSQNTCTAEELLGNLCDNSNTRSNDLSSSLNALTESKISAFSKAVLGGKKKFEKSSKVTKQVECPIETDILMVLLYYLFPDADSESKSPYPEEFAGNLFSDTKEENWANDLNAKLSGLKSAPYNSLPWRLAIVMAHVIHSFGGVRSGIYLWYEFTQELRFRLENNILIPGLELTFPDPRTCLFYQKLQLLNCCISKKIEREKRAKKLGNEDSDSDEEFFDCSSDVEITQEELRKKKSRQSISERPMGRLTKHGELKLLETGDFLYIPKTQDPIPKTEDQLEEDAEVLLQLGADAQGSELRSRLMSASLLSDMEAFKAANPGCILADFIRWYSPRDWILDEGLDEFGQPKGHLSSRMEIPGNTWLEVWEVAKPIPVKWQRRLFNDTRESEKILDFFEQQNPKGFIDLLFPIMSTCVLHKLIEECANYKMANVREMILKLIKKVERLQRSTNIIGENYKDLINDIYAIELFLIQICSLTRKFVSPLPKEDLNISLDEVMNFIRSLLLKTEAEVPGGPKTRIRHMIEVYFNEAIKVEKMKDSQTRDLTKQEWKSFSSFPHPSEKEIILRCTTTKGPQRLHAILKRNEFRLCGAFTKDDIFY